ncbi:hypothetical protein, partial [Corallococcus sp. AB038B]|uniref:hypothetical protein n=1 Tax=Corallococcus sp. AB038B TaxID=2316718 RepID=UPI001F1C6437
SRGKDLRSFDSESFSLIYCRETTEVSIGIKRIFSFNSNGFNTSKYSFDYERISSDYRTVTIE